MINKNVTNAVGCLIERVFSSVRPLSDGAKKKENILFQRKLLNYAVNALYITFNVQILYSHT